MLYEFESKLMKEIRVCPICGAEEVYPTHEGNNLQRHDGTRYSSGWQDYREWHRYSCGGKVEADVYWQDARWFFVKDCPNKIMLGVK